MATDKLAAEMLDRFERAAMAYERLGKLTKDDEKTREIRKAAIAELADARRAIFDILSIFDPSDVAWFEKETFAELNKRKTAEATISALEAENKRLREALAQKDDRFAYWNGLSESVKARIRQNLHNDKYGGADD